MLFEVTALFKPHSEKMQADLRNGHVDFFEKNKAAVTSAGAFTTDDGETRLGMTLTIDVEDRAEAESFIARDAYHAAGLYESVIIRRVIRR